MSSVVDSTAIAKQINSSPWKMSKVDNIGRVLVATHDIQPWEKMVEDFALITVPTHRAVCLGCLGDVSGCVVCVRCKWPMCRQECQNSGPHQEKCRIFQQSKIAPDIENLDKCQKLYSLVSVLRVLLLKNAGGIKWEIIKNMLDHKEARYREEKVVEGVKMTTNFFREKFGLDWATSENVQHSKNQCHLFHGLWRASPVPNSQTAFSFLCCKSGAGQRFGSFYNIPG